MNIIPLRLKNTLRAIGRYVSSAYHIGMFQVAATLQDPRLTSSLSQLVNPDQDLATFLNRVFKIAIGAGAILAVLRIGWAGYLYIASDLWTSKAKGREVLQDVALGLFLLIAIYIILYQINPEILNLDAIRHLRQTQ